MKKETKLELIALALNGQCETAVKAETVNPLIGKNVVVRARNAGVHIGEYIGDTEGKVYLKNSNRIWNWEGSFTLSDVSQNGIKKGRVGVTVPDLLIPLCDVAEILTLQENARRSIISNIETQRS